MKKLLISFIYSIPFFIIWFFFIYILLICRNEGVFVGFDYVYGKYIYIILYIIGTLLFLSIIYLRLLIKREVIIQFFSVILAITLGVILYVMVLHCDMIFQSFSTEKFIQYPGRRLTMYFDLIENYDIKGYTYDEIEKLLGKPDIVSDESYVYLDGYGNHVNISFKNGKAVSFDYSE